MSRQIMGGLEQIIGDLRQIMGGSRQIMGGLGSLRRKKCFWQLWVSFLAVDDAASFTAALERYYGLILAVFQPYFSRSFEFKRMEKNQGCDIFRPNVSLRI